MIRDKRMIFKGGKKNLERFCFLQWCMYMANGFLRERKRWDGERERERVLKFWNLNEIKEDVIDLTFWIFIALNLQIPTK